MSHDTPDDDDSSATERRPVLSRRERRAGDAQGDGRDTDPHGHSAAEPVLEPTRIRATGPAPSTDPARVNSVRETSSEVRRIRARPPPPTSDADTPFGHEPTARGTPGPAGADAPFGHEPTALSKPGAAPRATGGDAPFGHEPTALSKPGRGPRATGPGIPFGHEPTAIRGSGAQANEDDAPFGHEPTAISKSGPSPRQPIGLERTSVRTVTSDSDPLVGAMLGEYRVLGPLGTGGMGVVYRGEHPVIGKPVAIKVLRREFASDPDHVRRFLQEARVVNAVRHPGIVDIFSFGDTPTGEPYLVMELLEGETLEAFLRRRGTLTARETVELLEQLLVALGAAHAAGVTHRDLKPANVFLVKLADGTSYPKLLDFGLARQGEVGARVRQTSVGGTPLYIAPEQANGDAVGPTTDLYSLGCLAYELLSGAPPFTSANLRELIDAHLTLAPKPLRPQARGIPPELERLVLQMLEKDPAKRPASAAEVKKALEALRGKLSAGAHPTRIAQPAATRASMEVPRHTRAEPQVAARPVWPLVLGGVLLVALGAGGAALVLRPDPPPPPPPVAPKPVVTPEPIAPPKPEPVVAPEPQQEPPVAPEPADLVVPAEPKPVERPPRLKPRATRHTAAQVQKRWGDLLPRAEQLPDNLRRAAITELKELGECSGDADACWEQLSEFEATYFKKKR